MNETMLSRLSHARTLQSMPRCLQTRTAHVFLQLVGQSQTVDGTFVASENCHRRVVVVGRDHLALKRPVEPHPPHPRYQCWILRSALATFIPLHTPSISSLDAHFNIEIGGCRGESKQTRADMHSVFTGNIYSVNSSLSDRVSP